MYAIKFRERLTKFKITLDCFFEPNPSFTDRDETGARLFCLFSTRPTDSFQVLVLHAAPYNLARKCTSLIPINPIYEDQQLKALAASCLDLILQYIPTCVHCKCPV